MSEIHSSISYLTIIAGRKLKESLLEFLVRENAHLINVSYGRRAFKANFFKDMFGLVPEESKVILTCLIHESKVERIFQLLNGEFDFDKMNTGIAFTSPVDKISI